jgi:hypothetical protein
VAYYGDPGRATVRTSICQEGRAKSTRMNLNIKISPW